jgi:hypothetical protein
MVSSCSTAVKEVAQFASTIFIAPRHTQVDLEKSHVLLRGVEYRNHYNDRVSRPIFGLGSGETAMLVNQVFDRSNGSLPSVSTSLSMVILTNRI